MSFSKMTSGADVRKSGRRWASAKGRLRSATAFGLSGRGHSPCIGGGVACEKLEQRQLLTGTWTTITNAVPASDGAQNGMVLSDGSIMVHGGSDSSSAAWYKLTPSDGSYVNGSWSTLASMSLGRLFFASNVLPSGKVLVLGGEYTGPSTTATDNNSGEIYDPLANSWSPMATYPQANFGDDPTEMLPNGDVLAGFLGGPQTYFYNPASNAWTSAGTKLRSDQSDEECWVKLPDDSILSYDVYSSIGSGTPHAQRYYPSSNTWVDAGTPPAQLSASNVGYELGAGLLLPNGQVLYIGATSGRTAYYNPSANTWSAGPGIPNGYVAADAPAAVLPNGDVLMVVSPQGGLNAMGNYNFPGPAYCYELNTTTGIYTNVTPSLSGFSTSGNSYRDTFLVLPTGQVAWFNESGKIAIYTESGSPNSSWAPTIYNITNNTGSNTFTLTGYQLNGISEGAAYGDDNEMSSNYPIIQLTDQYGTITFARTFNWTLDGTASADSSVSFTEPVIGDYIVNVIANGIASTPVLDIPCSSSNGENFAIQPYTPNLNYLEVNNGENGSTEAYFLLSNFTELIMTGDAANNTLVINDNLGGKETIINGGNGTNTMDVENNGAGEVLEYGGTGTDYYDFSLYSYNLGNTANFTYVEGGSGNEQVQMYDNNYSTGTTYTVTEAQVTRAGFGSMSYAIPVDGITLTTGTGVDTVNVTSTYTGTPVTINNIASATVNIGSSGSVQYINASVTVVNAPNYTILNIDDSADAAAKNDILISNTSTGSVTGLAPVPIYWTPGDISGITIKGGTGGNDFYVLSADIGIYTTTIDAGTGSNLVQFDDGISGNFLVNGQGNTTVYVLDNLENSAESWTVNSSSTGRSGFSVSYSSIISLVLDTGYGNDTVDIESDPCPTNIANYGGQDTYNVTTGSMNLASLGYTLTVNGGYGSSAALNVNNSAYAFINFDTITSSYVYSVGVYIYYSGISTLTYDANNYANVVYLTSTYETTAYVINGGSAGTDLDLGEGDLTNVTSDTIFDRGGITFNAGSSSSELVFDDSSSSTPLSYVFSPGGVTLTGHLVVTYSSLHSLVLDTGTGNDSIALSGTDVFGSLIVNESGGSDTVKVTGTSLLATTVFNGGSGNNTFTVTATGGTLVEPVTVNGQAGTDTLTVNDLMDANFWVTSGYVAQYYTGINAIEAEVYYTNMNSVAVNAGAGGSGYALTVYNTATGTPVTVNNGAGTDIINVESTAPGGPVIISPSAGNDPINVGTVGAGTAVAEFTASQQIGVLTIGSGGDAVVTTGTKKLLQADSVVASGTGLLDLTTNDMIVHSSSLASVGALVKSGFNSGTWTGAGITSSSAAGDATHLTALATIQNKDDVGNPIFSVSRLFDGDAPSLTDILVKYTYYGDTNLDGGVSGSDYTLADNGYLSHLTGWFNGDLNYDGVVNGSDYTLMDNDFNRQGASLAAEIAPAKASAIAAPPIATSTPTLEKDKKIKAARHPLLET